MEMATFRIWRGEKGQGKFQDYTAEVSAGMVVLDAVHQIQAEQAGDLALRWNCKAGKCGSCSAEVNGMPKLMCMTRLNTLPLELPGKEAYPEVPAAAARRARWLLAHCPGGCRKGAGVSKVHRMLSLSGCLPRLARPSHARTIHRPAFFGVRGRARNASFGRRRSR